MEEKPLTQLPELHHELGSIRTPSTKRKWIVVGAVATIVMVAFVLVLWFALGRRQASTHKAETAQSGAPYDKTAAAYLTNNKCEGTDVPTIVPPMKLDQVSFVLPYGLMIGGHVTPIDHQYYNGLNVHALRDTYDVVAPTDGTIIDIQHRGDKVNTPAHTVNMPSSDEYRFVIMHSCSFITYVDLVTSIADSIKAKLPAGWTPQNLHGISIAVKQGDVIGHIGGQTLDFAVWDLTQKPLDFINRTAYDNAEPWKVFTAPPSKYFDPSVKDKVLAKYVRTAAPIDGKLDYDKEGKLIGTWFREGSNGYAGPGGHGGIPGYWFGHLSFAPNYLDPSVMMVSTGNFSFDKRIDPANISPSSPAANDARQFWLKADATDPAGVTTTSGLVKYDLLQPGHYSKPDGTRWDEMSWAQVKAARNQQVEGALLVQMLESHKLKVEFFPGKTASQVNAFDANAKIYNRGDDAKAPDANAPTSTAT